MPYIPHTEQDIKEMLATLRVNSIDELFAEIPKPLRIKGLQHILPSLTELEVSRLMQERAAKDQAGLCFIGAGAYEHYIPAPVWEIAGRGELMTAYTPYQAEASQGTLQITYEYQSMMVQLMGMDVFNASLYDGASAVGEAALMAVRANQESKAKTILIPNSLHPSYRRTARTIAGPQAVKFVELPFDSLIGTTSLPELEKHGSEDITAVIIAQPNFFGVLEEVDAITNWAHQQGALVIAVVNPIAMALLKEPGKWGDTGADIVVGDGQPLGSPLSSGGPYFGFMGTKAKLLRTMPGRVVGKTTDIEGNVGYVLNLQVREQHIRRGKATSNICTNQALMATAATIYMSLLGAEGLRRVAASCNSNANELAELLTKLPGVEKLFSGTMFHEFVLKLNRPAEQVLEDMAEQGIQAGYSLTADYPELGKAILVCVTETKTKADLAAYREALQQVEGEL